MDSRITAEVEGVASAQLVRPDVAQVEWLAFPLAAIAWGMTYRATVQGDARVPWNVNNIEDSAFVLVDQLPDFDAWRVGGGVAFRW
jgi:hypothetical protein